MYNEYWGLTESPFSSVLDAGRFVESAGHDEALARLLYIVEQRRGCGVLVGPAGSGKSLLLRMLAAEARRLPAEVAHVDLLGRTSRELLWETVAALGLGPSTDDLPRTLWRNLDDHVSANRLAASATVLVFDHLDRADPECTCAIERLIQIGAAPEAGLTVVLAARSERLATLNHTLPHLADLHVQLPALDRAETARYIEKRVTEAGANRRLFEEAALERVFIETVGIPRDINRLCDLALVAGMADGAALITEAIVAASVEQWRPIPRPLSLASRRLSRSAAEF